jgi:hypothetical protein
MWVLTIDRTAHRVLDAKDCSTDKLFCSQHYLLIIEYDLLQLEG